MVATSYYENLERERQEREEAEREQSRSINKSSAIFKGVIGVLSGNEAILNAAIKGSGDDFIRVSNKMSDEELALSIISIVAFTVAGEVGARMGARNVKGGNKITFRDVEQTAKSKGYELDPSIKSKIQTEINKVNNQTEIEQIQGLQRIRADTLTRANELLKTATGKEKVDLENAIRETTNKLQEGGQQIQVIQLNKADPTKQYKIKDGNIVRDLQAEVDNLNKLDPKIQFKVEDGAIVRDRKQADPEVIRRNQAITEENLRIAQESIRKMKEAEEKAKAEDKAIDQDPDFDMDEKGQPDEVIETREELKDQDKPDFRDEAKETEPLMEREQTIDEMIDESIERDRQEKEGSDIVKKVTTGAGSAIITTQIIEKITREEDDEAPRRRRNFEEDDEPGFTNEPVKEGEEGTQSTQAPAPATTALPGLSKQEFRIVETVNVENNDRYFDQSLFYATKVYDPDFIGEQLKDEHIIQVGSYENICLIKKDNRDLFVAFRGSDNIHNWMMNLTTEDAVQANTKTAYSLLGQNDVFKQRGLPMFMNVEFHAGFLAILLNGLYFDVIQEVQKFKREVDHIILTGHSMGGALAGIFYYLYSIDNKIPKKKIEIQRCITWGSPRYVKNIPNTIEMYNDICPNITRVFNIDDIVSYLPLNEPIDLLGFKIASGFKHVGVPRCLDGENKNNNINTYTVTKLQTQFSINLYNELLKDDEVRETERYIKELLYSKTFNSILIGSLVRLISLKQCSVIADKEIQQYTIDLENVIKQKLTYDEKIKELSILGIDDILRDNKVGGEDPRQEDIGLSAIFGMAYKMGMDVLKYHSTEYYRELLDKAIELEAENKKDITEPIGVSSELNKNTQQKQAIELRLNKQINDLKDIQGIIYTNQDLSEPVFIEY